MKSESEPLEPEEQAAPVAEEFVPGIANGRNYMAQLCQAADGSWSIEVIHVEAVPPREAAGASWPTQKEAAQAAERLVAALAH